MSGMVPKKMNTAYYRMAAFVFLLLCMIASGYLLQDNYKKTMAEKEAFIAHIDRREYPADKKVLFISSYQPTFATLPEQTDGIHRTLKANRVSYDIVYMNARVLTSPEEQESIYHVIRDHVKRQKLTGKPYAGILAGDDNALLFVLAHQQELFKDTPVVFFAVNDLEFAKKAVKDPDITGFLEPVYIKETVALAKKFYPEATQLIAIHDETPGGMGDWKTVKEAERYFPGMKVSDINTSRMTNAEYEQTLQKLPKDAIVVTTLAMKDRDGRYYTLAERGEQAKKFASVPVFSYYKHGIGEGFTGGYVMDMVESGEEAAELLVKIMNGDGSMNDYPLNERGQGQTLFNAEMMMKFRLPQAELPADTVYLNKPPTLLEYYQPMVMPWLLMFLGIAAFAALYMYEQKTRLTEIEAFNRTLDEARQTAEQANNAKTEFLFNMSHDIRTPMNAIMGFRDALEKNDHPEKRLEYLKKIKDASAVLLSILNNVLAMARIERGTMEVDEGVWNVDELANSLFTVLEDMIQQKGITFNITKNVKHDYIYGDAEKMREVFVNIFTNAYKYTEPGGRIDLDLTELPSEEEGTAFYRATIKDTGIGISEEFMPHIFDIFAREHNTTASKVEGAGLGLPIAKRLIELMHGTIEVTSKKGEGTTVIVTLPHRLAEAPVEARVTGNTSQGAEKKRILLAEDNDINAEIAMMLLEEGGYKADRAEDGRECLEMLAAAPAGYYGVVLMDIQMPNMNGYDAARAIRGLTDKEKSDIPIVAVTANAFEEDKRAAFDAGMNGHVSKPVDPVKLMKAVEEALR